MWDREDKEDWDKEDTWSEEFKVLLEACEEGDEESCDELAAIREDREKDREEELDFTTAITTKEFGRQKIIAFGIIKKKIMYKLLIKINFLLN